MSKISSVISLSSSEDEGDTNGPPSKKKKTAPTVVPNVTLSLVSKPKATTHIECVSLDSDDDLRSGDKDKKNESNGNKPKTGIGSIIDSILNNSTTFKKNGVTIFRNKQQDVMLVDSDSDTDTNKKEVSEPKVTDTYVNGSLAETTSKDVANEGKQQNCEQASKVNGASKAIVIADSDEEVEKENQETLDEAGSVTESSSSSVSKDDATQEAKSKFESFLTVVIEQLVGSAFQEVLPKKVPIIKKYFRKSGTYVNDPVFLNLLKQTSNGVKNAPTCDAANSAILAFHKVFQHLKTHVQQSTVEIEEDHVPKVKKLEKIIKLLRKKIKQLEEMEVNFDDDGDSSYIMLDRYQNRLKKVYAKYCEYIRRNPFSGRPIYDKISFVHSKYNEINQALSRKYRNSVHFPTYYEIEKYIRKVVNRANLDLSDQEIKIESKKCFKHLGNILQKKRRQELYDSHLDFIELTEDPAAKDVALENVLRKNYSEGKEKIDKLCQTYVNMQETGDDQVSSHNEDKKSSESSSDSEDLEGVVSKPDSGVDCKTLEEKTSDSTTVEKFEYDN